MSFYVTLPSNSSLDLYPNNTVSDFTVSLKEPIKLETEYEVALVEVIYKHSWSLNVGTLSIDTSNGPIDVIELVYHDGENIKNFAMRLNGQINDYYIEKEYNRRYELFRAGNTDNTLLLPITKYAITNRDFNVIDQIIGLEWFKNLPQFSADPFRFVIYTPGEARVKFRGNILKILNLQDIWYHSVDKFTATGIIDDPNPNLIESLFIYCDIIDYQYVGDAYVPLLKNVVVENSYPKTAWVHYDRPHYVNINKSEITSVHIEIRDDLGNKIKFENGKVILKLHLRPKRV